MPRTNVKDLVMLALFVALTYLGTMVEIPIGTAKVHLGDAMFYIIFMVFGFKYGIIAGAVGIGMADLFSAWADWTIPTVIIRILMSLAMYLIIRFKKPNELTSKMDKINRVIAVIVASIIGIVGYSFYRNMMYGQEVAFAAVPTELIKASVSVTIASILIPKLSDLKSLQLQN